MSSHEVHQIYFEQYLRKKMSPEERADFEQKLEEDIEIKRAFEHYKLHRKKYLRELIEEELIEHKKSTRLNHTLYLLISVTCIILTVAYYIDNKHLRNVLLGRQEFENMPLVSRIPYIIKKPPVLTNSSKKTNIQPNEDSYTANETNESFTDNENERLLADTTLRQLIDRTDSTFQDVELTIELWYSPIGFKGYRYNGRLLQLYGLNSFNEFVLSQENTDLWLTHDNIHISLKKDFNFHKF